MTAAAVCPRNVVLMGDVKAMLAQLPDASVHCVVTSPPYWSMRDYGMPGQLGLEPTLDEYIDNQVEVFSEVRRVMHPSATLWLNVGDSYVANSAGQQSAGRGFKDGPKHEAAFNTQMPRRPKLAGGLKPKDLAAIPWRLALALHADGWWLRTDIVWSKPNPVPESVRDRPTRSHEFLFLLTKSRHYFYDQEAIREPFASSSVARISQRTFRQQKGGAKDYRNGTNANRSIRKVTENVANSSSRKRNKRTVWTIAPEASREKHFATFPKKLVEPCIQAGTSEIGACSFCGAPWRRQLVVIDHAGTMGASYHDHDDDLARGQRDVPPAGYAPERRTTGWAPTCDHEAPIVPCLVLDPYMGSGTTGVVAATLGRDYLGIELNPDYVAIAEKRLDPFRGRML